MNSRPVAKAFLNAASVRVASKPRMSLHSRRLSSTATPSGKKNAGKPSRLLSLSAPVASSSRRFSAVHSEAVAASTRTFSSTQEQKAKNRIYTPVRRPDEFLSYLHASTSFRIPLITLWTASYSPACRTIAPLIHSLINNGVGEGSKSSANYCEVEYDSPDIAESDLSMRYMITDLPTLVTFDRGELITETKITDVKQLMDENFLIKWIEREAKRRGDGSSGPEGGLFGGLFQHTRN